MIHHEPHDDARFDRLVDGELSSTDYQALLASLDDEPGGWRRCALSFLEAQALQQELGGLRHEASAPLPESPMVGQSQPPRHIGYPLMALAMAASFLVAFGLGMAIRRDGGLGSAGGASQIVKIDEQPSRGKPNSEALASGDRGADSGNSRSPLAGDRPVGNVTLVVDGSEPAHQQRVEVPLYNADQLGQDYLTIDQSALTPELREMLERQGHEIRRYRRLVPVRLQNGEQAVFPMEEVEIVPVRGPAF
jgi:hypothetical protein